MALRVKIELVPYGVEANASILDEFTVANNGTGVSGGADSGGVGNYDVYDRPIGELHAMDYPQEVKLGEVRGIERTPSHRVKVVRHALEVIEEARKDV